MAGRDRQKSLKNLLPLAARSRYHCALKMGYFSTEPASERRDLTGKNRVWDFFCLSSKTHPAKRRQPAQPRRKIRPTPTKTVSGIPYWPSRDPIGEEEGGTNLYEFVRNDGVDRVDYLGWWTIDELMHETFGPIPPLIQDGVDRIDVLRVTWQCEQWGQTFVRFKKLRVTGQRLEYKGNGKWEPFAIREMVEEIQVLKDWGFGAEVSDHDEAVRLAKVALDNKQVITKRLFDQPPGTVVGQNQGQGDLYNPHCTKRCYKR